MYSTLVGVKPVVCYRYTACVSYMLLQVLCRGWGSTVSRTGYRLDGLDELGGRESLSF
jgi:hypothetical protein